MMKIRFIILFLFIGISAFSQEITEGVDSTITNYYGYDLSSTTEKIVWFRNSYLESAYNGGFMLRK